MTRNVPAGIAVRALRIVDMPPSLRELAVRLAPVMPRTASLALAGDLAAEEILRVADARRLGAERAAEDWDRCSVLNHINEAPAERLTIEIGVDGMMILLAGAPAPHWLAAYDRGYVDAITKLQQDNPC